MPDNDLIFCSQRRRAWSITTTSSSRCAVSHVKLHLSAHIHPIDNQGWRACLIFDPPTFYLPNRSCLFS
jgi:hypothetical protein